MLCKPMARGFGATVEDIDLSVELSPGQVEQLLRSLLPTEPPQ